MCEIFPKIFAQKEAKKGRPIRILDSLFMKQEPKKKVINQTKRNRSSIYFEPCVFTKAPFKWVKKMKLIQVKNIRIRYEDDTMDLSREIVIGAEIEVFFRRDFLGGEV